MLPSQQDFLAMVEHEKNHKRFIFVCGAITGIVISGISYCIWYLFQHLDFIWV